MKEYRKAMNMFLPESLHNKMKARAASQGISATQYITDLILADLEQEAHPAPSAGKVEENE